MVVRQIINLVRTKQILTICVNPSILLETVITKDIGNKCRRNPVLRVTMYLLRGLLLAGGFGNGVYKYNLYMTL